jgi:hypothetical protein
MAKITISRVFESSKALATDAGKELSEFITYCTDVAEQSLRALRNGLTFQDNVNSQTPTVSIKHNIPQTVNTDGKIPWAVWVAKSALPITSFYLKITDNGSMHVTIAFLSTPVTAQDVTLIILFK